MKSTTHLAAAVVLLPVVFAVTHGAQQPILCLIAFIIGAKAPDWLEIRTWVRGVRLSVIPHRTITHTWWLWVLFAALSWLGLESMVAQIVLAFAAACLLHIGMDALTPMGVPLLNPFGRRRRLNLGWLSKDFGFLAALLALSAVFWKLQLALA